MSAFTGFLQDLLARASWMFRAATPLLGEREAVLRLGTLQEVGEHLWPLPSRCQENLPPPSAVTTQTISRYCHTSLEAWRGGQNYCKYKVSAFPSHP